VHGAAAGWTGQVSVFASGLRPDAPCYRCWVPETPPDAQACDEVGVVGALTGIVGSSMALEVVKLVTGAGAPLAGRLLLIDGLAGVPRVVGLKKDATCRDCN
jgi:molybdopterin-synthase adenylyltransferase